MSLPFVNLEPGDPAPWFKAATSANPRFVFDTVAGRYVLLCFAGTASDPLSRSALEAVEANRRLFDDDRLCLFGVSVDPSDRAEGRVADSMPGIRWFWDFDGEVSRLYGALPQTDDEGGGLPMRRMWVLLDPTLRVLRVWPFRPDGGERAEMMAHLRGLPPPDQYAGFPVHAPVLILPNVFERGFCELLVNLYEIEGGEESGFMRQIDGKTVGVMDYGHKRRSDVEITDPQVISAAQARIKRRIVPEIAKIHQFHANRIERHIVGCYSSETGGHFRPHRDNTTTGTAHRRFAVSINLNDDFEGGEVWFPEYGARGYKVPTGGAVVFSCSMLHAVRKVTAGARYAFLPFLYDDEAAKVRQANLASLAPAGTSADPVSGGAA